MFPADANHSAHAEAAASNGLDVREDNINGNTLLSLSEPNTEVISKRIRHRRQPSHWTYSYTTSGIQYRTIHGSE